MTRRVVVIGAGIVGASIAYHLARRGAAVTVLDRGQPAGEATEKSFAWINATWGHPEPYFRSPLRSSARRRSGSMRSPRLLYRHPVRWA
jgi:glycine/D-amino acid oxidase-like deaminating enzyme